MSETTPTPATIPAAPEFVQLAMVMCDWHAADTLAKALMETGAAEHVALDLVRNTYFKAPEDGGFAWNDEETRISVRVSAERIDDAVAVMRAGYDYDAENLEITITPVLALVTADPAVVAEAAAG